MWNKIATSVFAIATSVVELLFVTLIYLLGWQEFSLQNPTFSKSFDLLNRKHRMTVLSVAVLFLVFYVTTFVLASEGDIAICIISAVVALLGLSVFVFLRWKPKHQDPKGMFAAEGTLHGLLTTLFFLLSPIPLYMLAGIVSNELYVPATFCLAAVALVIIFVILSETPHVKGTVKFLTLAYGFELIFTIALAIYFGQLGAIVINSNFDEVNLSKIHADYVSI